MARHAVVTTDRAIEHALATARLHDNDPVALSVKHCRGLNVLGIELSNHRRLVLPVEDLQGLEHVSIAA